MMSAKANMRKMVNERIETLEEIKITSESLGLSTMGFDSLIEKLQTSFDRWVELTEDIFNQL